MHTLLKTTLGGLAIALATFAAAAQPFPSAPITILCGFAPGGPTDAAARIAAKVLADSFKGSALVETRAGANGLISIQALKKAKPDGYTLLAVTAGMMTVTPAVKSNPGYDPIKDFTPIAIIGEFPYVLVARNGFPANDTAGLIEYAKRNPGKVSYGSAGVGSSNHLSGEWFAKMAGVSMTHVPYKGDAPAVSDLIAERLDVYFMTPSVAMPQVAAGMMKVLGVAAGAPTPLASGVTELVSKAVPGFKMGSWIGVVGPAGMPHEVVQQLNAAISEQLKQPQNLKALAGQGQDPVPGTPDQFAGRIREELGTWTKVAADAKISID
jgi:tripartite-type tricarboxylate transporter receptor subunit TctC